MNNTTFVYGSELQGRGYPTKTDLIVGYMTVIVRKHLNLPQNTDISPYLAIIIYHFSYTFAYIQCVMNFIIALNRFVAVWLPLHYQRIFNKKLCIFVAVMVACQALSVITLYLSRP
ncbi:hypothetical protein QR680_016329 [Steinernema hermaphroditum]|uniref:7TM GPCR serpentine receptor class x (Srx) domain-containing protein n=1 Tax=Steinernema hermaphroditum TaxID=289476 RepID=A0AA39HAV7_9BILA|nr:hypothetical protein QR680_016329 [Steinernema hermaphroditum]